MSGHEEGDCSRQSGQQCERHGSQMISWIVRRTKRKLKRIVRLYMDADEAGWRDMEGYRYFKALKVSVAILNLIRASIGSQWSLLLLFLFHSTSQFNVNVLCLIGQR